jgi:2-oxoglutarate ferredoxin oxidoreductase subunit delta
LLETTRQEEESVPPKPDAVTGTIAAATQYIPGVTDMRTHPVDIFDPWCKRCQLCYELCPKKVFDVDPTGRVYVKAPEACSQCRICALHCPDYAILLEPKPGKQDDS